MAVKQNAGKPANNAKKETNANDVFKKSLIEMTKGELEEAQKAIGQMLYNYQRIQIECQQLRGELAKVVNDKTSMMNMEYAKLCVSVMENATSIDAYGGSDIIDNAVSNLREIFKKEEEGDEQDGEQD